MKVTVLGSGAWGTALAIVLVENGNDVTMWSHRREAVAEMQQLGVNPKLKDVPLPKELHLSSDPILCQRQRCGGLCHPLLRHAGDR